MKATAVRIYGKNDLRLETFELPALRVDEILAEIVCDSLCMSSHKAALLGKEHKRIPDDIAVNPTIIGHEFSGRILEVGEKWKYKYQPGMKFAIQPAIYFPEGPVGIRSAPGYSYKYFGGEATFCIIPNEVMENNCLFSFTGSGFYAASLAEPFSCVIGAIHSNYHSSPGNYKHEMDIKDQGNMVILGGAGPMGMASLEYLLHSKLRKPSLLVITDTNQERLEHAIELFSPAIFLEQGIRLEYINPTESVDPGKTLLDLTDGCGFHDVFVFSPSPELISQSSGILSNDGCMNFFAGPSDKDFYAPINFYDVHYNYHHFIGTSGGNSEDMKEALALMEKGMDPAPLVTHIGGLDAAISATLNLPFLPGGKKLIYPQLSLPLTPLNEFEHKGKTSALFKELNGIIKANKNIWCAEAEEFLLTNASKIE